MWVNVWTLCGIMRFIASRESGGGKTISGNGQACSSPGAYIFSVLYGLCLQRMSDRSLIFNAQSNTTVVRGHYTSEQITCHQITS